MMLCVNQAWLKDTDDQDTDGAIRTPEEFDQCGCGVSGYVVDGDDDVKILSNIMS